MDLNALGRPLRTLGLGIAAAAFLFLPLSAQQAAPIATGPEVNQKIPAFSAPDQNGRLQDFNSLRGPKGLALYFSRSVDW